MCQGIMKKQCALTKILIVRIISNWTGLYRNMVITGKLSSILIDTKSLS